jgi:dimeric dUTPase (all-alpha-NTP-PPase superfamily)
MGKRLDREYEVQVGIRMTDLNIVKEAQEKGLDPRAELEKEVRKRNLSKCVMQISDSLYREWYTALGENLHTTVKCMTLYTLKEKFGFGKTRLQRFQAEFDNLMQNIMDLDYMGEHYLTMTDCAVELNEQYDLGIDINRVAVCQDSHDENNRLYRDYTGFKGAIGLLRSELFKEYVAADKLENHMNKEIAKWEQEGKG